MKNYFIAVWILLSIQIWAFEDNNNEPLVSREPIPEQTKLDELKPLLMEIITPDWDAFKNERLSGFAQCSKKIGSIL